MTDDGPDHWPNYCEENVWRLCGPASRDRAAGEEAFAVFISNAARAVAIWSQREAKPGQPVLWDYHVVFLTRRSRVAGRPVEGRPKERRTAESGSGDPWVVVDHDSTLSAPTDARQWLDASFLDLAPEHATFAPRFRLVPATLYRRALQTDRSHMREGAAWSSPPPPWPHIGTGTNLMQFVDMQAPFLGELVDLRGLRSRLFGQSR